MTFNSEFSYVEVSLSKQKSKLLEIEDKINITLVINQNLHYKNGSQFSSTKRLNICKRLLTDFCLLVKIWAQILIQNISKKVSRKYSQKLLSQAKQSTTDAPNTASKNPFN